MKGNEFSFVAYVGYSATDILLFSVRFISQLRLQALFGSVAEYVVSSNFRNVATAMDTFMLSQTMRPLALFEANNRVTQVCFAAYVDSVTYRR